VLASMFILLALSVVYGRIGSLPWIAAYVQWLKTRCHRSGDRRSSVRMAPCGAGFRMAVIGGL
jgi:hypothetical protein